MEELDAIGVALIGKQRLVAQETNLAVSVVFESFKKRIELLRRCLVGHLREVGGHLFEISETSHGHDLRHGR